VVVADFNADGKRDVAIPGVTDSKMPTESNDAIAVWIRDGRGGLREAPGSPYPGGGGSSVSIGAADLNAD
jgi:hypothetical protein